MSLIPRHLSLYETVGNHMKKILQILIILLTNIVIGQNNTSQIETDTVKIITPLKLNDENIEYKINRGVIYFSKRTTLKLLYDEINILKHELKLSSNKNKRSRMLLEQYNDYYNFINENEKLILINPWKTDSVQTRNFEELSIKNKVSVEFLKIACSMIDSGNFRVVYDTQKITKILKLKQIQTGDGFYSESNLYTTENGLEIWNCLIESIIE